MSSSEEEEDRIPLLCDVGPISRSNSRGRYRVWLDVDKKRVRASKSVRFKIESETEPAEPKRQPHILQRTHRPPPGPSLGGTADSTRNGRPDSDGNSGSTTLVSGTQAYGIPRLNTHNPDAGVEFLHRVILEALAFSYGVDLYKLESALSGGRLQMFLLNNGRLSLLTHADAARAFRLGEIAASARDLAANGKPNSLSRLQNSQLIESVIEPAEKLGVPPAYFLEKVMELSAHRCIPGKQKESLLYKAASDPVIVLRCQFLPFRWWSNKQQRALARRLITDEIILAKLTAMNDACMLIRLAIGVFQRKHCKTGMKSVARAEYVDPIVHYVATTLRSNMQNPIEELFTGVPRLASARERPAPPSGAADTTKKCKVWARRLSRGSMDVQVDSPVREQAPKFSISEIFPLSNGAFTPRGQHSFSLEDLQRGTSRPASERRAHTYMGHQQADPQDLHSGPSRPAPRPRAQTSMGHRQADCADW
jgi:hypothetical protein